MPLMLLCRPRSARDKKDRPSRVYSPEAAHNQWWLTVQLKHPDTKHWLQVEKVVRALPLFRCLNLYKESINPVPTLSPLSWYSLISNPIQAPFKTIVISSSNKQFSSMVTCFWRRKDRKPQFSHRTKWIEKMLWRRDVNKKALKWKLILLLLTLRGNGCGVRHSSTAFQYTELRARSQPIKYLHHH